MLRGAAVRLRLIVAFVVGFGLAYAVFHQPAKPAESCAKKQERAALSVAAIQTCSNVPGCQIRYADLIEVREQVVAARACK